jgi:hypothetical protein
MHSWLCSVENKQDRGLEDGTFTEASHSRWPNAKLMAFLLVCISWLAAAGCSPQEEQQSESHEEQQEASNVRIDELLEAAEDALREGDWDAGVSNARNVLEIDPNNVKAQGYEFSGLLGPLPEKEQGGLLYKVLQGNAIVTVVIDPTVKEISIPNEIASSTVTRIHHLAFYSCLSLTSVTIPASVTSIGDLAFFCCKSLTSIAVAQENPSYASVDGILFSKDGKAILVFPAGKKEAEYKIPNSVTSIGDYAFSDCESLTSVTIPDSVTSIGDGAFFGCDSLTSMTIPDSVTSIGDSAFLGCDSLTSMTIPASVTSIGNDAFFGCKSLTSMTIPASVTSIGDHAFFGCKSLTSVTIPDGVKISNSAFLGCPWQPAPNPDD